MRNVRAAVQSMVSRAHGPEDRLVYVDSSHGNGDGRGSSYLCLLPDPQVGQTADERAGTYWDRELAADLGHNGANQAATFVFLDACFSGGLLAELVEALPRSCGTSTCSQKGYGYDESVHQHGAWTQTFLLDHLVAGRAREGGRLDLVGLFQQAYASYVRRHPSRGDRPCFFARMGDVRLNTNDVQEPAQLPLGVVSAHDMFGLP